MAKQTLQTIQVSKVYPNFYQPRTKFDSEGIKELSESILGNGLINPITVRKWTKGRFMIVAGERRWRAHKIAKLKQVDAFVKEYKDDIDWQVESLVENWQREDLTSSERENNVFKLWKTNKFKTNKELADRLGTSNQVIFSILSAKESRDELTIKNKDDFSSRILLDTKTLNKKDKEKLLKKVSLGEIKHSDSESIREYTRAIKIAPEEVKQALFNNKINPQQAERISKLKTEKERERAIKDHSAIKNIEEHVEKNITNQSKEASKRSWDKRLMQSKNWIQSFRGSVTDSRKELETTFKILAVATRFIPVMDEKQKEDLEYYLDKFLETLEKSKQLAEKIQGYVGK